MKFDDPICGDEHENTDGYWTCTLPPGDHGDHEARDVYDKVCATWTTPVTSAAPEPTDEQWATAVELLHCEEADDEFPYCDVHGGSWPCVKLAAVARALAAAVTAEREKVRAQYETLAVFCDNAASNLPPGPDGPGVRYEDGVRDGLLDAAHRIRKVSR